MRITRDVPGSRLTLEGDAPRIPPGAPSAVLFVVCLPFFGYTLWTLPAVFAEGAELSQMLAALGLSLFWFSLFFATARAMRQRGRWPTGVDADRAAGELRLRESRYFGGVTPEAIIPLPRIEAITVRRTGKAPSLFDPMRPVKEGPGVALTFRIRGEGRSSGLESREVVCGVEHLDRPEEVVDLALRLGAATGLTFFRTVRSDARDVEMELRRGFESGFREVPAGLGRADYAKDLVAAPARAIADTETVPLFEPRTFRGDHRIAVWTPGSEVRFRKPREPEQYAQKIELVLGEPDRMNKILEQLLQLSRLEAGQVPINTEPVDLSRFFSSLLEKWQPLLGEKQTVVELTIASVSVVAADAGLL